LATGFLESEPGENNIGPHVSGLNLENSVKESKCAEMLQLEIPIQRKRGRPRRKSIDPQVLATMTSHTSIKSEADNDGISNCNISAHFDSLTEFSKFKPDTCGPILFSPGSDSKLDGSNLILFVFSSLLCTEDADSVSDTTLTKHTGDSDEEILKHTEDVDLKSKETMVFRNNESNALSDCSNEKKCQSEQFTKVKVVEKVKCKLTEDDIHVSVTNYDKDTSVILGTQCHKYSLHKKQNQHHHL
jgi:hypothetical protein